MTLRSELGKVRQRLLSRIHSRPVLLANPQPVVSFCFDDFPRTAYTVGGAILKNAGVRGTYYTALGLMNTRNELGDQFTSQDLESLLSDGHEVGCHTFSHISCRRVPFEAFENDVRRGCEAVCEITGKEKVNFAYPFGHVTITAKRRLGFQMGSSRGIYGGLNARTADLNLLRANSLYGDVDQYSPIEALLSENLRMNGWLIFYTHDVHRTPSPFGCTPELLEKTLVACLQRGFRVRLVEQVVAQDSIAGASEQGLRAHSAKEISWPGSHY